MKSNSRIWDIKSQEDDVAEIKFLINQSSIAKGSLCPICNLDSMLRLSHKPLYNLSIDGKIEFEGKFINSSPFELGAHKSSKTEQLWMDDIIDVCSICGWWRAVRLVDRVLLLNGFEDGGNWRSYQACTGVMKKLSQIDISPIINNARLGILKRQKTYSTELDPTLFEDVVNSEIKNFGYESVVTAKTRDGGIDIIGDAGNGELFGIQVKCTKNNIGIEQIRTIVGALVENDLTHGIFVTTSKFSSISNTKTDNIFNKKDFMIELIDGAKFLNSIEISQRKMYTSAEELIEYYTYHLKNIMPEYNLFDDGDCSIENSIM